MSEKQNPVEILNTVVTVAWTSPVDGQTYTVTRAAAMVGDMRDQILCVLRQQFPSVHEKVRAAEVAAIKAGDVAALRDTASLAFSELLKAQLEAGKGEHPIAQRIRYMSTDILQHLSPEKHAQYRAVKYADGGKATQSSRLEATTLAFSALLELVFVPGY